MKFFHYTTNSNKGGCTIAYEVVEHKQGKTLVIAFSQVSKKDYYCKKRGRDVSLDRYLKGETTKLVIKNKKHLQYVLMYFAMGIMELY